MSFFIPPSPNFAWKCLLFIDVYFKCYHVQKQSCIFKKYNQGGKRLCPSSSCSSPCISSHSSLDLLNSNWPLLVANKILSLSPLISMVIWVHCLSDLFMDIWLWWYPDAVYLNKLTLIAHIHEAGFKIFNSRTVSTAGDKMSSTRCHNQQISGTW